MTSIAATLTPVNDRVASALHLMRQRALAVYPAEQPRIDRGHSIALQGGVTLHADGTASVLSQSLPDTFYTVNGHCICRDERVAPGLRCKHKYAKALLVRALAYLAAHPAEPLGDDLPTPYVFPRWTRYAATYVGPDVREPLNGIATRQAAGGFMFIPDGADMGWACGYAAIALGPGLD